MRWGRGWARRPSGRRALVAARTRRRAPGWLERGLLLAGIACLGLVAVAWGEARWVQAVEGDRLAAARAAITARCGPVATAAPGSPAPCAPPAPAEGDLLGRIDIARVGISAIILEGSGSGTLRHAVGHVPSTALPGEAGNAVLTGHRDSYFRGLRTIARGDRITITTPAAATEYLVEETAVVAPDAVEVLGPTAEPTLTLITCYPFRWVGPAPRRYVVRARRVGDDPSTARSTSAASTANRRRTVSSR